tara:strand:+ start:143 stop:1342 length:1200 start_codon:yes stop_codon:yes gene_type:complete
MTRKGVWDLQEVRDKYLASLWVNTGQLWSWGDNNHGQLGQNDRTVFSSPVQISGDWTGASIFNTGESTRNSISVIKTDGTLWVWGNNDDGCLGLNQPQTSRPSSPTQVTGTTWAHSTEGRHLLRTKTNGTLWASGYNGSRGQLGLNDKTQRSSPTQVGTDTTWDSSTRFKISSGEQTCAALKTNGTLWMWGHGEYGLLGNGIEDGAYSSPTQVGTDTTWTHISCARGSMATAIKTNGTLWTWGRNEHGQLGLNTAGTYTDKSSPTQIGTDTTWRYARGGNKSVFAVKTDGTLWSWGYNKNGALGLNTAGNPGRVSSPTQIPGTTWNVALTSGGEYSTIATKTDGTLWSWGYNYFGQLGQNQGSESGVKSYSSPVQIPGSWSGEVGVTDETSFAIKNLFQ